MVVLFTSIPSRFIESGEDFAEAHGALGRLAAEAVSRADDLAVPHAAAGE